MLDRRWRKGVEQGLGPVGDRLRRLGITADALTVFGLACSLATAVLIASGHFMWALAGLIVAGVSDLLDGTSCATRAALRYAYVVNCPRTPDTETCYGRAPRRSERGRDRGRWPSTRRAIHHERSGVGGRSTPRARVGTDCGGRAASR